MDTVAGRRAISPAELGFTVLPTVIFLAAALVEPAWTSDPSTHRITNSIWLATILLIPALCL